MSAKPTRDETFKVLGDFEPLICDLYLDIRNLRLVWNELGGQPRTLTNDEQDQLLRQLGVVEEQAEALRAQFYAALKGGGK